MTSQANQRLEEKTKPIESFDFKAHQLSEGVFEKILVSNNLNKIKTDSYYFTSDTDTYQEPGQGHVETYHHRKEKRNLMKDQELLLAYSNHQEWEFTKDG